MIKLIYLMTFISLQDRYQYLNEGNMTIRIMNILLKNKFYNNPETISHENFF